MKVPSGFLQLHAERSGALRAELAAGLQAPQAAIAPKFLYDGLGSRLFEAICELPEYYLTRSEAAILRQHLPAIAEAVGPGAVVIDLGAGSCRKAAQLLSVLRPRQYVAVDIDGATLRAALASLQQRWPALPMLGLAADFSAGLCLPPQVLGGRRLFFYAGSSIGNFPRAQAVDFLRGLRGQNAQNAQNAQHAQHVPTGPPPPEGAVCELLIGVDLRKEAGLLHAAYDDALGVTAAFNRNVLRHVNRLLQTDFDLPRWRHRCTWDAPRGAIDLHLEADSALTVRWPGGERRFAAGETIHTETSCKYTEAGFAALLEDAGFRLRGRWTDAAGAYLVCHAVAA